MAILHQSQRLKKELTLLNVYAIALGATLSSGFFLLPGLAAAEAGPAVVVTYAIALLPLVPGIMSKVELSTAMPRAGGVYYFLDRSIGPAFGTIGGFGTWLALDLKVAFALVGIGAYLQAFWPGVPIRSVAVILAIAFGVLNLFGSRRSGLLQVVMVGALLALLCWFIARGAPRIQPAYFEGFFDTSHQRILSTAGLVCISYIGLTKVVSVSEEVKQPERNLPWGIFLALATAIAVYMIGTAVIVGVVPPEVLYRGAAPDLHPVATAARVLAGRGGAIVMTIAAVLAFFSVANAGILSASRYPLAMSRDHLLPRWLRKLGPKRTPVNAIAVTVVAVVLAVLLLDPLRIAKLAGAFQLLLFASNCIAVVVMRESRLESYDPGYRAPFYPWLQIVGIVAPFVLIAEMGWMPVVFTGGLVLVSITWFFAYARRRVSRRGAISHLFNRLGRTAFDDLDRELRGIMKEKGLRAEDPFDEMIIGAAVIEADADESFERIVQRASTRLADQLPCSADVLVDGFMEGTRTGATPVTGGVALPHMRLPGVERPEMVIVRSRSGVSIAVGDVFGATKETGDTHALFFLVSPVADPGQHLRMLAELASRMDDEDFLSRWLDAADRHRLKEVLLRHEQFLTLRLSRGLPSEELINKRISEIDLPEGCLVAVIRRETRALVPRGDTVLLAGDRLSIIGHERAIATLFKRYSEDVGSSDEG